MNIQLDLEMMNIQLDLEMFNNGEKGNYICNILL